MYLTAVIWLFWVGDSFCVAHRFWLPWNISKTSWTWAILCTFPSSAPLFISESFSLCIMTYSGWSPAKIQSLDSANCLTTSFSRRVSPVFFDCPQPMTSCLTEKLDSTPTLYGKIENMSRATWHRLAYFVCVCLCCHHQSVMSGMWNLLLLSIGSEW